MPTATRFLSPPDTPFIDASPIIVFSLPDRPSNASMSLTFETRSSEEKFIFKAAAIVRASRTVCVAIMTSSCTAKLETHML